MTISQYAVRPAESGDLSALSTVETAADQLFIDRFQPETWDEPATGEWRAAQPGFLLVAGRPVVGIAHVLVEDDAGHSGAHLEMLAVPWNAPYYLRLGFSVVDEPTGVLARHLEHEQSLNKYDVRVGMVRRLVPDVG